MGENNNQNNNQNPIALKQFNIEEKAEAVKAVFQQIMAEGGEVYEKLQHYFEQEMAHVNNPKKVKDTLKQILMGFVGDPIALQNRVRDFEIMCNEGHHIMTKLTHYYYKFKEIGTKTVRFGNQIKDFLFKLKDFPRNFIRKFIDLFVRFRPFFHTVRQFVNGPVTNLAIRIYAGMIQAGYGLVVLPTYIITHSIHYTFTSLYHGMMSLMTMARQTLVTWGANWAALYRTFMSSNLVNTLRAGGHLVLELTKRGIVNATVFVTKTAYGIGVRVIGGIATIAQIAAIKIMACLLFAAGIGVLIGRWIDNLAQSGSAVAQLIQKPIGYAVVHLFLSPGEGRKWQYNNRNGRWESIPENKFERSYILTKEESKFIKMRHTYSKAVGLNTQITLNKPKVEKEEFEEKNVQSKDFLFSTHKTKLIFNFDELNRRKDNLDDFNSGSLPISSMLTLVDTENETEYKISPNIIVAHNASLQEQIDNLRLNRQLIKEELNRINPEFTTLEQVNIKIAILQAELLNSQKNLQPAIDNGLGYAILYYRLRLCLSLRSFLYYSENIIPNVSAYRRFLVKYSNPTMWSDISPKKAQTYYKLIKSVAKSAYNEAKSVLKKNRNNQEINDNFTLLTFYKNELFYIRLLDKKYHDFDKKNIVDRIIEKKRGFLSHYVALYSANIKTQKKSQRIEKVISKHLPNEFRSIASDRFDENKRKNLLTIINNVQRDKLMAFVNYASCANQIHRHKRQMKKFNDLKAALNKKLNFVGFENIIENDNYITHLQYPSILDYLSK